MRLNCPFERIITDIIIIMTKQPYKNQCASIASQTAITYSSLQRLLSSLHKVLSISYFISSLRVSGGGNIYFSTIFFREEQFTNSNG